jgi:Flp pilus assembly protein TadD
MRGFSMPKLRIAAALLAAAGMAMAVPPPAAAAASYSPYSETAAAALARYVRTLASSPRDFTALVGAGRAALALGDSQAAAGFFGRADEVNPSSPLPQAGIGAVLVASGEPAAALPYFARAQQLGAPVATFGADRGLAYDLLGQQAQAQGDYRSALGGPDSDEARRRLAMSLAISGKKDEALQTLAPLQARGDTAAARCRAFVLALTGDSHGAMRAIDAAMPGSWSRVAPFLDRLPALASGQKAAAVNLGIFPDPNATAMAYASPPAAGRSAGRASTDRLTEIEQLLRAPPPPPVQAPAMQASRSQAQAPAQMAYAAPTRGPTPSKAPGLRSRKIWLQLASGSNPDALPSQFRRLKARNSDLFDGISGYVAKSPDRARLLIGPFRGSSDAETFAEDLDSAGIDAFSWTNSETDTIVPLGSE